MTAHKTLNRAKVPQRQSTKLKDVEAPLQFSWLDDPRRVSSRPIDIEYLQSLRTTTEALQYSVQQSRQQAKSISDAIAKDKATWSKYINGETDVPVSLVRPLRKVLKNDALLLWLVHDAGYDLHSLRKRMDDKDRRIAELEAELVARDQREEVVADFVASISRRAVR